MTLLRFPLGLLVLALSLPLAAPRSHAQSVPAVGARLASTEHAPGGVHIVTVLPDGALACDVATEAQVEALRLADRSAPDVRLTPLPSLNQSGVSQFRIIIRATDQLLANPTALLSFRRAAARWERIIQTPVTTVIDLDYGPNRFNSGPYGPNVLASANSANQFASSTAGPTEIVAEIRARTTDPATLALLDAIPIPTPTTHGPSVFLGRAIGALINLQALGFRADTINPDPTVTPFGAVPNIGFNSAFAYDFNPNDGITTGQTDFDGVVVHEIGHALGFVSSIGQSTAASPIFTTWDMYRVRPEAVTPGESYTDGAGWEVTPRVLTPGPPSSVGVQVMFTGDAEYEVSTATGGRVGGDGQQASHWRADEFGGPGGTIGIMDPTISPSVRDEITPADVRALSLFGYLTNSTPSTAAATLTIGGQPVNIDFLASTARGSVAIGGGSVPIVVANVGTSPLDFAFEVFVDSVQTLTPGTAPTVAVTPADGTVSAGGQSTLALNVSGVAGGAVVYGRFYLRTNDPARAFSEVPFQVSVGSPGLAPTVAPTAVEAQAGQTTPATVEVRSSGDAPLTYIRVLEPAASDPATAYRSLEGEAVAAPATGPIAETTPTPDGADETTAALALAQLNITGGAAFRLYDLAQLPTGEVVAVDGGVADSTRIFLAPADLSALTATYSSRGSLGGQVTGIAYNKRTASLWVAVQETGLVREVRLEGNDIVLTGQEFATGVAPFGMDYSPELDAFFVGVFDSGALYAFEADGDVLPGYPAAVPARATPTNGGLSFTEGLLEMQTTSLRYFQAGQFGRTVAGTTPAALPASVYGLQRSPLDPNGTLFLTTRTTSSGLASIRTLDPPDLPAGVGTRLEAAGPLYSAELLAPGTTRSLALLVDATGLPDGMVTDELAFLTNAPTARIVRFPVTINVMSVAGEEGPGDAINAVATWPNPARAAAQVQLTLSVATTVTVAVYNTLGQRVAVLAQAAPLSAGTHALALPTSDLAAGVYVVRVEAGRDVSTHKVTVVR